MRLTLGSWQVHSGAVLVHPCKTTQFPNRTRAFSSFTRKEYPQRNPQRRRPNPRPSLASKVRRDPLQSLIRPSPEIIWALESRQPVVALETTIYTHGFPYPDNVRLALDLETIVRQNGAIPATIGILDGVARVGMSSEEITALASAAGKPETMKVSRRDLPYILGMVSEFKSFTYTMVDVNPGSCWEQVERRNHCFRDHGSRQLRGD
jgi:hypothetical protein